MVFFCVGSFFFFAFFSSSHVMKALFHFHSLSVFALFSHLVCKESASRPASSRRRRSSQRLPATIWNVRAVTQFRNGFEPSARLRVHASARCEFDSQLDEVRIWTGVSDRQK